MTDQAKQFPHRTGSMLAFWMVLHGWREDAAAGGWKKILRTLECVIPYAALAGAATKRHPELLADFVRGFEIAFFEEAWPKTVRFNLERMAADAGQPTEPEAVEPDASKPLGVPCPWCGEDAIGVFAMKNGVELCCVGDGCEWNASLPRSYEGEISSEMLAEFVTRVYGQAE